MKIHTIFHMKLIVQATMKVNLAFYKWILLLISLFHSKKRYSLLKSMGISQIDMTNQYNWLNWNKSFKISKYYQNYSKAYHSRVLISQIRYFI